MPDARPKPTPEEIRAAQEEHARRLKEVTPDPEQSLLALVPLILRPLPLGGSDWTYHFKLADLRSVKVLGGDVEISGVGELPYDLPPWPEDGAES